MNNPTRAESGRVVLPDLLVVCAGHRVPVICEALSPIDPIGVRSNNRHAPWCYGDPHHFDTAHTQTRLRPNFLFGSDSRVTNAHQRIKEIAMPCAESEKLLTIGQIAQRLGQPLHRVRYVVETRGIEPAQRIAHCRAFTIEAEQRIAAELRRMTAGRTL